jgi:hypothetical protein
MPRNRDEFLASIIKALALRANYKCSFQGCGISTSGAGDESPTAVVSIGVAAHIHAAAPGGPRYSTEMTPQERSSITNGIWLCQTHSRLIDQDSYRFSPDKLREMKKNHERRISEEMERPTRSSSDGDFIAIGLDLVFTGKLIGVERSIWRIRIDHFLIGNLSKLIQFIDGYDSINQHDRYVIVNELGDGRQLASTPTWQHSDSGGVITCEILESCPRINANHLPTDLRLGNSGDLTFVNGDLAIISGLAALPQKITTCLSTSRGELFYSPEFGARINEYYVLFQGSLWLPNLIKTEVIRLACIPYSDSFSKELQTPLGCVLRVISIKQLHRDSSEMLTPFEVMLEIEGVGQWEAEVGVFIQHTALGLT